MSWIKTVTSDNVMFWGIQLFIFIVFVISFFVSIWEQIKENRTGVCVSIERGKESMAIFYGSYAALSGILVGLCLSVDVAKGYRVLCVLGDTVIITYLCLLNPWSRNKILKWVHYLKKLEA